MNDHDLDALARRAAAELRADAAGAADSHEALARLLAEQGRADDGSNGTTTTVPLERGGTAGRWRVLAAAAALVTIVVGLAWLARSGSGTIDIVGPGPGTGSGVPLPTSTPAPTGPPDTVTTSPVPSGSSPSTPGTTPGTTSAPTPTPATSPATSVPVDPTDPFAGITPPAGATAPTIDDVPTLLPEPRSDPEHTTVFDTSGPLPATLSQLWVRADPDGLVDAVVQLTSRPAQASPVPGGELAIVAGWPDARVYASEPGSVVVSLVAPTGVVDVRAYGLDERAVLDIAAGLRPGPVGWASATLATSPWLTVDSSWSTGYAARTLVSLDAVEGDVDSEISIVTGWSMADAAPGFLDRTVSVVAVGDRTGLLFRGGVSALIVRRDDTTVVRLGSRDPDADLVAVAASLTEVDPADWDAASGLTVDVDGCIGLFC